MIQKSPSRFDPVADERGGVPEMRPLLVHHFLERGYLRLDTLIHP